MGYPIDVALRYLGSKKRAIISVGTAFAILGVALGVAALATVMSVTGGFQEQFREKVLGVNAHVLVLKYSTDFREYRTIMEQVAKVPGVIGVAPFIINPMMVTHGDATATGVLLKGVDPQLSLGVDAPPGTKPCSILPQHIVGCEDGRQQGAAAIACGQAKLHGLRRPGAKPAERKVDDDAAPIRRPRPRRRTPDSADGARRRRAGNIELLRASGGRHPAQGRRKKMRGSDAGATAEAPTPAATPTPDARGDADAGAAPQGDVVPDGGYKSVLPDDDVLPADVDPDPCAEPRARSPRCPASSSASRSRRRSTSSIGDCVTGHLADDRLLVLGRRARSRRSRKQFRVIADVRGRLRPVRLQARLHRSLRGAGLLRPGRQRDRRRDEGRRHRQGATRSRSRSTSCSATASTTRWTGRS